MPPRLTSGGMVNRPLAMPTLKLSTSRRRIRAFGLAVGTSSLPGGGRRNHSLIVSDKEVAMIRVATWGEHGTLSDQMRLSVARLRARVVNSGVSVKLASTDPTHRACRPQGYVCVCCLCLGLPNWAFQYDRVIRTGELQHQLLPASVSKCTSHRMGPTCRRDQHVPPHLCASVTPPMPPAVPLHSRRQM